ncbi:helix-turn-helix transcriptional regulator [Enterococcus hirae]|nr:helix-turn-helix transcriptional regulator [Enterococcus hirae]
MRRNNEIIEIIDLKRQEKQLSISELARRVGMAKSALSRYFNGTREFPLNRVEDFAKALDVSSEYLLGFDENSNSNNSIEKIYSQLSPPRQQKVYDFAKHELEEQQESEQKNKVQSLQKYREMKEQTEEFADIEWYGCASAGTGEFIFDNKEVISLPKKRIPLEADFCLTVNGDSMEPIIHDQDYIFVSKQDTLFNGNIGVVIVDGEAFIKKVFFENDKARLQSFNKKYKDIIVDDSNDFRIIGKVVM